MMSAPNILLFGTKDAATVRQEMVARLKRMIDGHASIKGFAVNFKIALKERVWESDRVFPGGTPQGPMSLRDFIYQEYPVGLGATYELVENLIRGDVEALALWAEVTKRTPGNENPRDEKGRLTPSVDNIHERTPKRPSGTSAQAGLRKLSKAAAEGNEKARVQLEAATSGVKSIHRACVEAGLRKETKKATEPTLAAAPPPAAVAALAPEPPAAPIVVEAAPEPPTPHLDAINFTHGGRAWTISTSRFADGQIAEIFLDTDESGELAQLAGDAATLASLALQHGCPLATIRHAIEARGGVLAAGLTALDERVP